MISVRRIILTSHSYESFSREENKTNLWGRIQLALRNTHGDDSRHDAHAHGGYAEDTRAQRK